MVHKTRIYLSFVPKDLKSANLLIEWLTPFSDEIAVFPHPHMPPKQEDQKSLTLSILTQLLELLAQPWKLLLWIWRGLTRPWITLILVGNKVWTALQIAALWIFTRVNDPYQMALEAYQDTIKNQRQTADIFLFLLSHHAIQDKKIEDDLAEAVNRRVQANWSPKSAPVVLPILLGQTVWKEKSKLSRFEPLANGIPLDKFPSLEDGYHRITSQILSLARRKRL